MNQRQVGKEKEELACNYLKDKGYQILAVNYWCREAELDIVAKERDELVFVEVKYRKNDHCGGSKYAVSANKIQKVIRGARYYLHHEKIEAEVPVRFDVIAIQGDQIWHYVHAFDADGWI